MPEQPREFPSHFETLRRLARIDPFRLFWNCLKSRPLLPIGLAATALLAYGFIRQWPWINGPDQWYWHYFRPLPTLPYLLQSLLPLLPVAAILGLTAWEASRR